MSFKIGAVVRHKSEFLRNISWFLDVPLNGKIVEIDPHLASIVSHQGGRPGTFVACVALVEWSDGTSTRILASNLEPDPRS